MENEVYDYIDKHYCQDTRKGHHEIRGEIPETHYDSAFHVLA